MKTPLSALFLAVALTAPAASLATPVLFDIDFGVDGSGTFTLDDSLLAAIPASGLYFGPNGTVNSFEATVAGILFDTLNFGGSWAAANGQISGVTGITNSTFTSSTTSGAILELNTCSGIPCASDVTFPTGQTQSVDYSVSLASDDPVVVPEPASLALLGLGIAGIGYQRRHKKTKPA